MLEKQDQETTAANRPSDEFALVEDLHFARAEGHAKANGGRVLCGFGLQARAARLDSRAHLQIVRFVRRQVAACFTRLKSLSLA